MFKKQECEDAIRHLVSKWAQEKGYTQQPEETPSFSEFWAWMKDSGYSGYQRFRTRTDPRYDAEMWFDEEMRQTWRN